MTWDLRKALVAALLLAAVGASWWILQMLTEQQATTATVARQDPDYSIEGFRATVMNAQGQRKYTLTAELMQHYPHNETMRLTKPHLVQYNAGRAPIHMQADFGHLDDVNKEIVMTGNVKIVRGSDSSGQGSELTTTMVRILLD